MIGHGAERLGQSMGTSTELRERIGSRDNKTQVGHSTGSREESKFGGDA